MIRGGRGGEVSEKVEVLNKGDVTSEECGFVVEYRTVTNTDLFEISGADDCYLSRAIDFYQDIVLQIEVSDRVALKLNSNWTLLARRVFVSFCVCPGEARSNMIILSA